MAVQKKRARSAFLGEVLAKRRKTTLGQWFPRKRADEADDPSEAAWWVPTQEQGLSGTEAPASGEGRIPTEGVPQQATVPPAGASGFPFGSPRAAAAKAPMVSLFAPLLPSGKRQGKGRRRTCGSGRTATPNSWRRQVQHRARRSLHNNPYSPPMAPAKPPVEAVSEVLMASAPDQHSPMTSIADKAAQMATTAEPRSRSPSPQGDSVERVIAMLCELVKNVSITRACLPVAKRCVMKRDMLAKRIDSLCVELEHQFDTINTLRNLADEVCLCVCVCACPKP